jgi:hypothetical protein
MVNFRSLLSRLLLLPGGSQHLTGLIGVIVDAVLVA